MTITSKGYTGSLNNVDWSVLADKLGAQFAVFGPDSFRVAVTTGDRALSVRSGEATGQGIRDVSDSAVTLTGAPVSSGDRWDMVALRRTWSTKTTTLVLVQGSSAKALPATRKTVVGDVVDHPLYLVRFTAGQTAAQELVDLRLWHGDGGLYGGDLLVREFLDRSGTRVIIGNQEWLRLPNAVGTLTWTANDVRVTSAPIALNETLPSPLYKARVGSQAPSATRAGNRVYLDGAADVIGFTRWVVGQNYVLGTVPSGYRPAQEVGGVIRLGPSWAVVVVQTGGAIIFAVMSEVTANADAAFIALTGVSWPVGG